MEKLELFNAAFAFAGVFVAFGVINRMGRDTSRAIRCAFVTTAAGLAGEAVSMASALMIPFLGAKLEAHIATWHWQNAFDTLLYGGVLGLLIGSRRTTMFVPSEWVGHISLAVTLGTWGVFLFGIRA